MCMISIYSLIASKKFYKTLKIEKNPKNKQTKTKERKGSLILT